MSGRKEVSIVRSSAAEYLTFIATVGKSETSVEMRYEDENIWLTQKMMATLYDLSVPAINQHLKRIFDDNELEEASVIKHYLTTASDGKNIIPLQKRGIIAYMVLNPGQLKKYLNADW